MLQLVGDVQQASVQSYAGCLTLEQCSLVQLWLKFLDHVYLELWQSLVLILKIP